MRYLLSQPIVIHEQGKRVHQEDCIYPPLERMSDAQRFFILCDGMGGHEAGDVASSTVCDYMGSYIDDHLSEGVSFSNELFERALENAFEGLDQRDTSDSTRKMGTTMSFLMFHEEGVTVAHIGDSRIYHFRPGVLEPLFKTRDHSLVNDMILLGKLTEEDARNASYKNIITRAMQPGKECRTKADIMLITDISADDWFYVCSDGMLEQMDDKELGKILTDNFLSENEKKDLLLNNTSSNMDNHSAIIIHVLEVIN